MAVSPRSRSHRYLAWASFVALATIFVALPRGFAEPRDDWSLEARIPASALGVVTIDSVGTLSERLEATALAGLFNEPEMKAFMAPIEKAGEEMLEAGEDGPLGEAGPMLMKIAKQLEGLKGQVAVAMLDFDKEKEMPVAAASMDFGPNVKDFVTFVQTMRAEMDPEGKAVREFQKEGRIYWQVKDGPPITATTVDTAFVMATDETLLDGVIAGVGEKNLAANAHFQAVRKKAGGDKLALFAYANVPAIVDMVAADADEEMMSIANHLGLDTIKAAAYGMALAGDGFMDSLIIHAPAADHGIVPILSMPKFEARALPFVPANAFYFEEGGLNIEGLLPRIRALAEGVEAGAGEEINEALAEMNEAIGVDIEKELLAGLAGAAGTYAAMPETGGLYPELAMMIQVKDPASFEGIMTRAVQGICGMVTEDGGVIASPRTLEYRKHKLHLIDIQAARGDDVIPFTPTWTMMGDWCVMTLVPHSMKEIILRREEGAGGGLAAQEDYQSLRRVMPATAGAFTYVDLQAILSLVYDTAVPLLQTAVKPNMLGKEVPFELDWAQLPAARTARPYFRSLGVFTTWNQDGLSVQMHGPFPAGGLMIVGGATAALFFVGMQRSDAPMSVRGEMPRRPGPQMPRRPGSAEARLASIQAEQLSSYVRVFVLMNKRLPKNLEELVSTDTMASLPKDPWGNEYALKVVDEKAKKFAVVSGGPDGQIGTADDVAAGE